MFITFEGVEGAGKTTQMARLAETLAAHNYTDILTTRQPGGTELGKELRRLVLLPAPGQEPHARAELLIMLADRAQHVEETIRPHLERGGIVLCDRFADSSVAYQGYGRGLNVEQIDALNRYATGNLLPHVTILLDCDPAIGLARQKERTRMEAELLPFHNRVRQGFLAVAAREPERFAVVDAARAPETVQADVWRAVTVKHSALLRPS